MEQNSGSLYLVMVNPNENNNKYYRMIKNGDMFEAQYGRVGVTGYQTKTYSMSKWDSTYKSKLKKGYIDQTRLVAETIIKPKSKEYIDIPNTVVAQIVERLQSMAKQVIADNYTISSNKVTKSMIEEAQVKLNNLIEADTVELFNKVLVDLFTTIPRKMGRVADYLASTKDDFAKIIQTEQDLLDVMRGQVQTQTVVDEDENINENTPELNKTILDAMGLVIEEVTSEDIKLIKENLGSCENKFYQAWKVKNIRTQEAFDGFVQENKIKDTRLLWHGSRSENWWSIINTGLVLRPNAVITGKLYGNGIYFAPKAQKSLGYTSLSGSYWVRGNSNIGFMALMDVAYGKPYDVYDFNSKYYNLDYKGLQGFCSNSNSLHAHAGASLGSSSLRNDEIIIYKEEQCTIRYLVELR